MRREFSILRKISSNTDFPFASVEFLREFQLELDVEPPHKSASSGKSTPLHPDQLRQLSWQQDSFIPQFLYDAMSENKRFDSMRVETCFVIFRLMQIIDSSLLCS